MRQAVRRSSADYSDKEMQAALDINIPNLCQRHRDDE